jgi:hypothetical protein
MALRKLDFVVDRYGRSTNFSWTILTKGLPEVNFKHNLFTNLGSDMRARMDKRTHLTFT